MSNKDSGIVNIHGKEYQTVAYRVGKFREKYRPEDGWFISTEIIEASELVVRMSSVIGLNIDGRVEIYATGHAEEFRADGKINKTSALENAETSAIGRALACFGLGGTEFASADEVARAVSGQKAAAPTPLDENAVCEAMQNAESVEVLTKYFAAASKRATSQQLATIKATFDICKSKLETPQNDA